MREAFVIAALLLLSMPVMALDNTTIYCLDNSTLMENITVYKDGNSSWYALTTHCENDCDNITMMCNPPEYQQSMVNFGIIILIILMVVVVWRWRR